MKPTISPDALFLTPPHSHDPSDVSEFAALPSSMLMQLPEFVQNALWTLQESTSVVYASYLRLQALLDERFERLVPLPSGSGPESIGYSETAFFNYANHLAAERRYLLEDAHPDWKHKASRAGLHNSEYEGLLLTFRGKEMTMRKWFQQLQRAEAVWIREAQQAAIPDFEATIVEFESWSQSPASTPGSVVSEDDPEENVAMGAKPVPPGHKMLGGGKRKQEVLGLERVAQALEAL